MKLDILKKKSSFSLEIREMIIKTTFIFYSSQKANNIILKFKKTVPFACEITYFLVSVTSILF